MKILIIRNYPNYMSVENNTYNIQEVGLAKAMIRVGHICDIIFWTDHEEKEICIPVDTYGKIKVFYKRGKTKFGNTVYTGCNELFSNYDILQPCEYNQMQTWLLARRYPEKTVVYHGPYYSPFNKRYNLMCKAFDIVFLNSYIKHDTQFIVKSKLAEKFLLKKGIKSKNIYVAGVGIDVQMLSNENDICDDILYKKMSTDKGGMKLLYIGKFEKRRNILFVIEVLERICREKPDTKLYMIGSGEPEYIDTIWKYAEKLGIRENIVWQERMEQKYLSEIYKLADCFLFPTEYEIFGMVLLEAMYFETVVLTTYNGGSSTLIQNKKNGFMFNTFDTDLWARMIISLCINERRKRRIEKEASRTINTHFTWDALVHSFENIYRSKKDNTQKNSK